MYDFSGMISQLKGKGKTIVFTEGTDARIIEAASRLIKEEILTPIMIGDKEAVLKAAEAAGS